MRKGVAYLTALVMVLCLVAVPVSGGVSPDASVAATDVTNETNETHPPDPPGDRLGWENGMWYNETISVTPEDGLNDSELDLVVARGMARVEVVRGIEFEGTPPVEVISREQFREERENSDTETSTANRLHQNAKWEAMFSIGEDENAVEAFQSTQTATVGGYYSFVDEEIVIISENTETPQMDEITLSQELFHALQDQRLRVSFNRSTREGLNAGNGIVEGDGNLVDRLYQQRCESEWECVLPTENDGSGSGDSSDINYGVYLTQFQPYSDGPKFVQQIRDEGGWDAVDDVYDNPPESTEQVIHTEKYPSEGPTDLTFTDSSSEEWYVPDMGNGSVDYARFGQAGLSAMFMRPVFASGGDDTPVVGALDFYNITDDGTISSFDPLDYGLDVTNGWGNDRLYPYATDDSAETNETGYVWKIEWDSDSDASEFVEGYEQLLEYYGAESIEGNESTYQIPDENAFGDAFYVDVNGTTVTIVNGPTVEDLSEIRAGAAPAVDTDPGETTTDPDETTTGPSETTTDPDETTTTDGTTDTTATSDETTAPSTDGTDSSEETTDTGSGFGPGFGVTVALIALLASAAVAARRQT